jgi:acyl carrier protein phosphodiesterase
MPKALQVDTFEGCQPSSRYFYKMNYLAHAFLSFDNPEILTGNMISDFVKGKKKFGYPNTIQKGIALHRMIDNFTDFHPATAVAKGFFRPCYRLYSGAFVDIVYDHFLALDKKQFESYDGLLKFSEIIYSELELKASFFPKSFQTLFPYMKMQNWLYEYRLKEGIRKSFGGLVHRAVYLNESDFAYKIFEEHYDELSNCYKAFFPELKEFALENLHNLLTE